MDFSLWCTEAQQFLLSSICPSDPCQCRSPSMPHWEGNWRYLSTLKRYLSTHRIRLWHVKPQEREVTSVAAFLQMPHFQELGLQLSLSSISSLGYLGLPWNFAPCPQSGNFYQQPQKAEELWCNAECNKHSRTYREMPVLRVMCIHPLLSRFLTDPKSRLSISSQRGKSEKQKWDLNKNFWKVVQDKNSWVQIQE